MLCLSLRRPALPFPLLVLAGAIGDVRDANACGACFHEAVPVVAPAPMAPPAPVVDTSFVTDHRMVLSMSQTQTVLWDQVRFSGSPKDFAWVLPVKPGARIEMSHDAWIAALDATTQTVITGPTPPACPGGGGGSSATSGGTAPMEYESAPPSSGGCGGGFASGGGVATYNVPVDEDASFASGPGGSVPGSPGSEAVQVVMQQVVGPYQAVTIHSGMGEALGDWLRANGFALPATFQPVVDAYAGAGFDFIALKLAPGVGVQAMQPVRVVTPGADPTLPLRMVAAGVGAHVGLELYVVSEGRYHPANFPDAAVDFSQLAWNPSLGMSNYTQLVQQALAAGDGTGWLTESSQQVNVGPTFSSNGLSALYQSNCKTEVFVATCPTGTSSAPDAGAADAAGDAGDAGDAQAAVDADADAGSVLEASAANDSGDAAGDATGDASDDAADAQLGDANSPSEGGDDGGDAAPAVVEAGSALAMGTDSGIVCGSRTVQPCDDLDVAMVGITGSPWLTRLRADFPSGALTKDLILEATASQTPVSSKHTTHAYTSSYDPCPPVTSTPATTGSATPTSPYSSSSSSGCACRIERSPRGRFMDVTLLCLGAASLALRFRRRR